MDDDVKAALEWAYGRTRGHRVKMSHVPETCDVCRLAAILAHIDGEPERLAAKAEEVREACAQWAMRADVTWDTLWECGDAIRATPLIAEPYEPPPPMVISDPSGALTRFDRKLFHELLDILGREVGNRGDSEGAVDVVERIIRERDEAVAALRALLPEVYGTHSPSTVGYAIDRHRIIAQARAVLAKYPEGER